MAGAKTTADDLQWRQQGAQEVIMTAQLPLNRPDAALVADGVSLERLRPLRMLGRSSSNTRVLLARDSPSGIHVAVKVLTRKGISPLHHHQVLRGCRAQLACASAPHVLPMYAVLQDDVQLYILTACGHKGDLAHFLANLGRTLTPVQAVKYVVKPLLLALTDMHALGIVHRDIKPENLVMHDDNTILLCDFDLAIDSRAEVPCSQVGTPDYVAPEVLSSTGRPQSDGSLRPVGARGYTTAVDIWAVGVLAWELLAGSAPFSAQSIPAIKDNVRNARAAAMPAWSLSCKRFVGSCMARDPAKRPTAAVLLQDQWIVAPT